MPACDRPGGEPRGQRQPSGDAGTDDRGSRSGDQHVEQRQRQRGPSRRGADHAAQPQREQRQHHHQRDVLARRRHDVRQARRPEPLAQVVGQRVALAQRHARDQRPLGRRMVGRTQPRQRGIVEPVDGAPPAAPAPGVDGAGRLQPQVHALVGVVVAKLRDRSATACPRPGRCRPGRDRRCPPRARRPRPRRQAARPRDRRWGALSRRRPRAPVPGEAPGARARPPAARPRGRRPPRRPAAPPADGRPAAPAGRAGRGASPRRPAPPGRRPRSASAGHSATCPSSAAIRAGPNPLTSSSCSSERKPPCSVR